MSSFKVEIDAKDLERLSNRLQGMNAPLIIGRALNHTGDKAKTQVIKALTAQTGLKRKIIAKAVKVKRASYTLAGGGAAYTLTTRGGDISLKYFDAKETRAGVSAAPGGRRITFAGAFIRGGKPGQRVWIQKLGGHVFKRAGGHRLKIIKQVSDISIPDQMTKGATLQAFNRVASQDLSDRIEHEINYALQTGGF